MRNPEVNTTTVDSFELAREEDAKFSLFDTLGKVQEQGIYIHQFTEQQAERAAAHIRPKFFREGSGGWNIKQGFDLDKEDQQSIWNILAPNEASVRFVSPVINYFTPGDSMEKHLDMKVDTKSVLGRGVFMESMLTFVFTAGGRKDILLYLDGPDNEPRRLTQVPGMLLVFPANDIYGYHGNLIAPGLFHEIPVQDANSLSMSWEIERVLPNKA